MGKCMGKWIVAALLCSLAGGAPAQTTQKMDEIRVSARVAPASLVNNLWKAEFDEVKGYYRLSNGKTMRLSRWGSYMFAEIDGIPRTRLVALTPYEFVALNESMRINIDAESGPYNDAIIALSVARVAGDPAAGFVRLTASR